MRTRSFRGALAGAALVLAFGATLPGLEVVKTSTKVKGNTTIQWESSFQDLAYEEDQAILMTIRWWVLNGAASYDSVALKHYTPRSKNDPVTGTLPAVTWPGSQGDQSVDVAFTFTDLHRNRTGDIDLGNAHFKLYLWVDKKGDPTPESRAGFGVSVHVEDPQ